MATKRRQPVPRPAKSDEWKVLAADAAAGKGWDDLCRQAPGPTADCYDQLVSDPRCHDNPRRHHRLRGSLGDAVIEGRQLEQWEHEVTGGGRVRFVPDEHTRTVWVVWAGTGHPKDTE